MIWKYLILFFAIMFTIIFIDDFIEQLMYYKRIDKNLFMAKFSNREIRIFNLPLTTLVVILWMMYFIIF